MARQHQLDLTFDADDVFLMFALTSRVGEPPSLRFSASSFETFPRKRFVKLLNGASIIKYKM